MAKKNFPFEVAVGNNFSSGISTHVDWEPRTNIIETENNESLVIEVELPGVIKDDVSIFLEEDSFLIIRGVKKQPRLGESGRMTYLLFEREFGSFYKRILLDFPVDVKKIASAMENGVLTVSIPRKRPQKVSVEIK